MFRLMEPGGSALNASGLRAFLRARAPPGVSLRKCEAGSPNSLPLRVRLQTLRCAGGNMRTTTMAHL